MYRSWMFGLVAGSIGLMSGAQATEARDMQACLGIQGGPIFSDAAANDGAKMERGPVGRCVALRDDVRTLRNRLRPAERKTGSSSSSRSSSHGSPLSWKYRWISGLTKRWRDIGSTTSRRALVAIEETAR